MSAIVAYSSPFVPPEWIAAHGLAAHRVIPQEPPRPISAGICPFAASFADALNSAAKADAAIFTTTCDQMRRMAEHVHRDGLSIFLMNVPATWQTPISAAMYADELRRLGRFLVRLGGQAPSRQHLAQVMRAHEDARKEILAARTSLRARDFANAVAVLELPRTAAKPIHDGIPLALVGGPLRQRDWWIYDLVEECGGAVALDATEMAERCLPAPFDPAALESDPESELTRAYFLSIPDAFRRPDTQLQDYLRLMLAERQVRGILLIRSLWCDHWHAQVQRLRQSAGMSVIEIDVCGDGGQLQRTRTRVEALIGSRT